MKKISQKIKLWKMKSMLENPEALSDDAYIVLYKDGTYERYLNKSDVYSILSHDNYKPVYTIFDMSDRFIIDRDILVEPIKDEHKKDE